MQVAVNTSARYANRIITLVVGFFLTPYLLYKLGPDSLGLQVIGIQALQYCMLFGNAWGKGFSRFATLHYARGDFDGVNRVLGRALTITTVLVGVAVILIGILEAFAPEILGVEPGLVASAQWVVLVIGIGYICDQFFALFETLLFVSQKLYVIEIAQIVSRLLSVAAVLLVFHVSTPSIEKWVVLTMAAGIAVKLVYLLPVAKRAVPQASFHFHLPKGPEFRELTGFSLATVLGTLGFLLYYASSSIVITHLQGLGTAKVFTYSLGQRWETHVREVVLAFAVSLTPVFTSFHATGDKESLRSSLISSCRSALLLAMFPSLFLFAFARPFLALWVGSAYATESSVILQLAILNVLISAPSIVAYEALVGLGRIRSVAVMMIIGGVFNILLAIVLADSFGFGLVGVAISMIVSYGIVACSYIMRSAMRELGVPLREFLAQAVVAPVFIWVAWVLVAFALQTYISPQSWLMLGVQFALVGFAFNVSVYTLLLSKSDKSSIREIRQKISATIRQAFLSNSSRRQGLPTKPVVSD